VYTRGETLNVKGAKEVAAYLRKIGASENVVRDAMFTHGQDVIRLAASLAPGRTGQLRGALSVTRTAKGALMSAGSERVPYAYTFHSGVVGKDVTSIDGGSLTPKTSGGYMVFRVNGYNRKGTFVSGYSALRKIHQNPYLFRAFNMQLRNLIVRVEDAMAKVIQGGV
jgi:hypothetical protein